MEAEQLDQNRSPLCNAYARTLTWRRSGVWTDRVRLPHDRVLRAEISRNGERVSSCI